VAQLKWCYEARLATQTKNDSQLEERQMDMTFSGKRALSGAILLAAAITLPAQAATVTFDLDIEFSGAQSPQGPAPWITAEIDDSVGGADTVRLTMTTPNLTLNESVTSWFFNFSGDATQLAFTEVDVTAAVVNNIYTDNSDSDPNLKADGDGFFDFGFDFAPPPGNMASRFTSGETIVYDLTYIAPISASDFEVLSAPGGGNGSFFSAAHVQAINDPAYCAGIGPDCGSGWIGAVPVPAAVWLFGSGLLGLLGVARKRRA
jgi:hypothetical protein